MKLAFMPGHSLYTHTHVHLYIRVEEVLADIACASGNHTVLYECAGPV